MTDKPAMNRHTRYLTTFLTGMVLLGLPLSAQTRVSLEPYFTPATRAVMTPDEKGFIQRWLLLEPILKPNRSNTVFTDSYLRSAFDTLYFPTQRKGVPKPGSTVKVGDQTLTWHALESTGYNVKLFRFATSLKKPAYGVLFWVVTVVNSPVEHKDIRLSVGSNSASMWWLNGQEVLLMSGDRRMVVDDATSKRIILNKGKNILWGAVINGPGMSDCCVRFLDAHGTPLTDLSISTQ